MSANMPSTISTCTWSKPTKGVQYTAYHEAQRRIKGKQISYENPAQGMCSTKSLQESIRLYLYIFVMCRENNLLAPSLARAATPLTLALALAAVLGNDLHIVRPSLCYDFAGRQL